MESSKKRILVMDDDEDVRFLVEIILGKQGYQVEFATKGDEAVTLYQKAFQSGQKYAAAILDLNIPGSMGGQGVAEAILAVDPDALLFVTSGNENDPVMVACTQYGFAGKLTKPFLYADAAELVNQIH